MPSRNWQRFHHSDGQDPQNDLNIDGARIHSKEGRYRNDRGYHDRELKHQQELSPPARRRARRSRPRSLLRPS